MKSIKIMGLCLVAVFVTSAVAVAGASAAKPEFRYTGTNRTFTSTSGAGTLFAKNGAEVHCVSDTDTGEIASPSGTDKVENVVVTFSECTLKLLGKTFTCQSGSTAGLIDTNKLEGQLGYINKTNKEVGLVLKPQSPATVFAEFECVNGSTKEKIAVNGEVIGKITPVNTEVGPTKTIKAFTLEYKVRTVKWEQQYQELEVLSEVKTALLLKSNLNGGAFEFAGIETSDEITPAETVEISA